MTQVPDHIFAVFEPNLEERIDNVKKKAKSIMTKQHETMEDMLLYLKIILAKHYRIPIFDEYFNKRTIDELLFEVEIVTMDDMARPEVAGRILKESPKEAEGLFDDWAEQDMKPQMSEADWKKEEARFMETGEFKKESE